ncbi:hypothetical protein BSKO_11748 [Bryopsis sp. KO-2023]|nr:hypothetical protein BSKO_11748 [Bryopsis sp. KO-2023]
MATLHHAIPFQLHDNDILEKKSFSDSSINTFDDDFPTAAVRRQRMEDSISRIVSDAVRSVFDELEKVPWTHTQADFLLCWDDCSSDTQQLHALWIAPSDRFYQTDERGKVGHNAIIKRNYLVEINDDIKLVADLKDTIRKRILRKMWAKGYKSSFGTVLLGDCCETQLIPYIAVSW